MKYLKIKNKNEICESAFVLMGASSKRGDDTKIGYFGTGIKYSLATFLRKEIPVKIYSGEKEITIETQIESMRGKDFRTLTIGGRQTSITTEMGINWETWQAIREIYCNAIDEESVEMEVVDEPQPEAGHTIFFIGVKDDVQLVIDNWDDFFSDRRTDAILKTKEIKVFPSKGNLAIYRKGIRCYQEQRESLFDYDLETVAINEARLACNSWELASDIGFWLARYATVPMVRKLFDQCEKKHYEYNISWSKYKIEFNDAWKEVIGGRTLINADVAGHFTHEIQNEKGLVVQPSLLSALDHYFGSDVKVAGKSDDYGGFVTIPANKKQQYLLTEALNWLKEAGLKIEYEIEIAVFQKKNILGQAQNEKILIAVQTFDLGKKMLVCTILEEAFHLESALHDETRAFQDFLINKLVTMLEEKTAFFL